MARTLTAAMQTEVAAKSLSPIVFIEADFDSGTMYLWNGVGPFSWNGQTWTGAGHILTISRVQETAKVRAAGMTFRIADLPVDHTDPNNIVRLARRENYQDRPVKAWLGALDSANAVVVDPYQMFTGRMDQMRIVDNGATAEVTLTAENRLVALRRPNVRRRTHEDQQIDFPGDKGFEFVAQLQDRELRLPRR